MVRAICKQSPPNGPNGLISVDTKGKLAGRDVAVIQNDLALASAQSKLANKVFRVGMVIGMAAFIAMAAVMMTELHNFSATNFAPGSLSPTFLGVVLGCAGVALGSILGPGAAAYYFDKKLEKVEEDLDQAQKTPREQKRAYNKDRPSVVRIETNTVKIPVPTKRRTPIDKARTPCMTRAAAAAAADSAGAAGFTGLTKE